MTMTSPTPTTARKHPALAEMFDQMQAKFLSDSQLEQTTQVLPHLAPLCEAAREIRNHAETIIDHVANKETAVEYPWESVGLHKEKIARDNKTVLAYATMAMLCEDPQWFDNRVLIWFKTILQSFDFPDKPRELFPLDPSIEATRKTLPTKCRAIFQTYSRIKQEYRKVLTPDAFELLEPYLDQVINTLTEKY